MVAEFLGSGGKDIILNAILAIGLIWNILYLLDMFLLEPGPDLGLLLRLQSTIDS